MSDRVAPDPDRDEDTGSPFGGRDVSPFEEQRRIHQFLTQETRYHIIQTVLGHPSHLASLDELEYLVPKNRSTISEHLEHLDEKDILTQYVYEGEKHSSTEPTQFWGPTEYGIVVLDEYRFLRYVPIMEVLQESLYRTDKIERHLEAQRPSLPESVEAALESVPIEEETAEFIDEALEQRDDPQFHIFDAPPVDPPETDGDGRPIDELF